MADPGNDGNKILVGLPARLDKYKSVIRQYEARESAMVLLLSGLAAGMIEVPTYINEATGVINTPIKVEPPLDAPAET